MSIYKNVHLTVLKQREVKLVAQMQNLGQIAYQRDDLRGDARMALNELFSHVGNDLRAVRAELNVRHGVGAAPLPELTEAPTVLAS